MKITGIEIFTYGLLYMFGLRNYCRILRRFYFFGIPFTNVVEYVVTIGLIIIYMKVLYRYKYYGQRIIILTGISILPLLIGII